MNRRTLLKLSGATGVAISTTGCLGWLPWRDDSGGDDGSPEDGQMGADEDSTTSGQQDTDQNNVTQNDSQGKENESGGGNETEQEQEEQPEAAEPPTDPEAGPNESEYADPEDVQASQPTAEDVPISNREISKSGNGTAVTGTLTNESGDTLRTVDVEVAFQLEDGSTTTAMWGTNNLGDGESWDFEVIADVPYESVMGYDIRPVL